MAEDETIAAAQPEVLEVADEAAEGVVQWYGMAKGYGFVRVAGIDEDVFVHHSQLAAPDDLVAGDVVRFRLVRTSRGLQAQDLEILTKAGSSDPVR
ncbi:MAG: cold shock domain-containing protein [Thermoanaerobaculia bacterium]|nr:cold shock domain-containing protein [Thermoanaerobaculia bacterium]